MIGRMPTTHPAFARSVSRGLVPILLLACLAWCGATARAGVVWMENGDRITGNILSLDNGILLVNTPYGGDLRLQFAQVKTLESDTGLVIHDQSMVSDYYAKLVRADQGSVGLDGVQRSPAGETPVRTDVPLASLDSMTVPRPLWGDAALNGKLDLSLNRKTASIDTQDYAAALQLGLRSGLWRNTLDAAYHRSKEGPNVNTDNYGGDYTLDRFLTEKAFWQARLRYKRDAIEDVSRQSAYGTGPGYQFWDDELGAFSLSALLGRIDVGYSDGFSESSYAASLRWDYTRYLSGKQFELYTNGELIRAIDGAGYGIIGELGLRYHINDWLSLYVSYARDQVSGGRQTANESTYGTGVGLAW